MAQYLADQISECAHTLSFYTQRLVCMSLFQEARYVTSTLFPRLRQIRQREKMIQKHLRIMRLLSGVRLRYIYQRSGARWALLAMLEKREGIASPVRPPTSLPPSEEKTQDISGETTENIRLSTAPHRRFYAVRDESVSANSQTTESPITESRFPEAPAKETGASRQTSSVEPATDEQRSSDISSISDDHKAGDDRLMSRGSAPADQPAGAMSSGAPSTLNYLRTTLWGRMEASG